jgi:Leucine-rich repeat (LRR) protein
MMSYKQYDIIEILIKEFGEIESRRYEFNDEGKIIYLDLSEMKIKNISIFYELTKPKSFKQTGNTINICSSHAPFNIEKSIVSIEKTPYSQFEHHLSSLKDLFFADNQIADIRPLINMTNLTGLGLEYNQIVDLAPLQRMSDMEWLTLEGNQITDLSPLRGMSKLKGLDISRNQITDLGPLQNITELEWLSISDIHNLDLSPLQSLVKIDTLHL